MSATRELLEVQIDGSQVIVGVFASAQEAERARGMLGADGFDLQGVNIVAKSREEAEEIAPNQGQSNNQALAEPEADRMQGQVAVGTSNDSDSRINLGTGVGVLTGAAGGAVAGLALLEVPGLGSLFAGSTILAMVVSGLIGAVLGAWGGSMAGIQVPEEDVSYFTGELGTGAYLVAVRTNRIDEALDVLRDAGARNLSEYEGH